MSIVTRNNNQNSNLRTTKAIVGLRLSNRWEPHTTSTTGTQNYIIESKSSDTERTNIVSQFEKTPKPYSDPKIAH